MCLNGLRERRNQVARQVDPFTAGDHQQVLRWVVCEAALQRWHSLGPACDPLPPGVGILHRHFLAAPTVPVLYAPMDPVDALFTVAPPPAVGDVG